MGVASYIIENRLIMAQIYPGIKAGGSSYSRVIPGRGGSKDDAALLGGYCSCTQSLCVLLCKEKAEKGQLH